MMVDEITVAPTQNLKGLKYRIPSKTSVTVPIASMESYISNVCSQPVRPTTTANQVRAVGGQECFFDALHTQLSNNSPEGDGKSMQRRGQYRSAPAPAPAPTPRSEPLPAYKVAGQAERYDNCGCIKNPNPVRAAVKRIVGKPEYLV